MSGAIAVPAGGYSYLVGGPPPFSNGVAAMAGYRLTRVRLRGEVPLAEGLAMAAAHLAGIGRPGAALVACELRSPAPMTRGDFTTFNTHYVGLLRKHGFGAAEGYPVARSNMAPLFAPPAVNTLFAFTYTAPVEAGAGGRDYLISGKPESTATPPGVIAPGLVSPAGMAAKAAYVIAELQARVAALGRDWAEITGAQAYTMHSLDGIMDLLRSSGLANVGLALFPSYPPVVGLDFEIDVRSVSVELVV
ncbi:MAG: hypothetical protein NT133_19980 [Alphaproteobacteria bacterium]|nr:hypothetical protein [Alphaproteobacteria bacterium]